ncbi:MAG: hypothetical protein GY706_15580, partial [Bacteroides sp.]|nr:hypothetical protein [Bacteroides sp.]
MAFSITSNVYVDLDDNGVPRLLSHIQQPYSADDAGFEASAITPVKLASQYVRDVAPIYQIDDKWLQSLEIKGPNSLSRKPTLLHLADQKTIRNTATISFVQTHAGLPVWQAGVSVRLNKDSMLLTSSQSSVHLDLDLAVPGIRSADRKILTSFSATKFASNIGAKKTLALHKPKQERLLIYRYDS